MKQAPHIGEMIKKHVKDKRLFQSVWARLQGISSSTIHGYLKNPCMRTNTLFTICQVLNYNFYKEIGKELPEDMPPLTITGDVQQVKELQQQVHDLQMHVAALEKALGLVGGR